MVQNITAALSYGSSVLEKAGIDQARREAASLLTFVLEKDRVFLIAHSEYELSDAESGKYSLVIERRASREPFHYITGIKEFYGLDFKVAPGVLIPRPETELLVEDAVLILSELNAPKFLEVGVGSGCISITILKNMPSATAIAGDISETAIEIAAENAAHHGVTDRLEIIKSNVYERIGGRFDLIVSNPPYIPQGDLNSLQAEVGKYEPHTALFGGDDGLDIVRPIVSGAPLLLNDNGSILIEIGFGQADLVSELFDQKVWFPPEFIQDHQGIKRIVKARSRP